MSSDRELTRIVRSWMDEGVNVLPDRVLDDVLAQLPVTSQRSPWWRAWRKNIMSSTFKLAATGAVVLVVATVALAVYFSRPAVVPGVTPSPTLLAPFVTIAPPTEMSTMSPESTAQPTSSAAEKAPFVVFLRKPDGSGTTTPHDLWAMRADGTDAQMITPDIGLPSVAWSRDGSQLLGNAEDVNGVSHVLIAEVGDEIGPFVDTGFGTGADTACHGKSGRDFPCQSAAFAMAPDGEHVAFTQACTWTIPGCSFISILDLRTGELTELTETLEQGRHKGGAELPAWSPDGTQIAFVRETNQSVIAEGGVPESNLYVVNADGTDLHQVELSISRVKAPQWSPDGSRIALMSDIWLTDSTLEQNVYTVRPDGTDLQQLTTDGISSWPEWTLSNKIRFRNGSDTNSSLAFSIMNADGSNQTFLVDLQPLVDAIQPPGTTASHITVPGDPGRSLFWQPSD